MPLKQGSIVWIAVPDPNGFVKRRPVVIVSPSQSVSSEQPLVGVAITTTFPDPAPVGHVELPWDATGRATTRLRRRSAAVCHWLVTFKPDQVDAVAGVVPSEQLLAILRGLPPA